VLRDRFRDYLVGERNLAPLTALTYERSLQRLERHAGKPADTITSQDVRAFLRGSDLHPSTKNSTLVAMKAFHKWGALEELWPLNGIMSVPGPRLIYDPLPSLSTAQVRTLLGAAKRPGETRLLYLGLFGGLRVGEMARIDKAAWTEQLRFVGKGRRSRDVPVHQELEARRDVILSRPTTDSTLKQTVRGLVYVTGIQFSSHTLRRTFATHLSEQKVPREVIGAILGHAPATVTERYAPVRWQEKVDAVEQLRY
jgi:site-specific recombinase XerD